MNQLPDIDLRDLASVTSLIISILTAYWNILRGAKYVSPPLRQIILALLPPSNTVVINFPIAITNTGSCSGVIDSFYVELSNLSTSKSERFYAWQEGMLQALKGVSGFGAEIPNPVSLKAGESTVRYYTFVPDSPDFMYTLGRYRLSLYACLGGRKKALKLYEQLLDIESVLQPQTHQRLIPVISSFNLLPKKILKVSNYGNDTTAPMIQIVKN